MPGQGDLPLVEYASVLNEIGYAGVLSLEIFNDRFLAGPAADIAIDGMRSLIYLFEQVEQRSAGARHVADPTNRAADASSSSSSAQVRKRRRSWDTCWRL